MRGRVPGENKACYELPGGLIEEKECFPLKNSLPQPLATGKHMW